MSSILASPIGLRQVAASNADPFSCQLLKQAADPMLKITAQQARVECASESRLWLFGQPFVTGSNLERPIAPDILDAAKDPTRLTQQGK